MPLFLLSFCCLECGRDGKSWTNHLRHWDGCYPLKMVSNKVGEAWFPAESEYIHPHNLKPVSRKTSDLLEPLLFVVSILDVVRGML
jgi:hypothetical protein